MSKKRLALKLGIRTPASRRLRPHRGYEARREGAGPAGPVWFAPWFELSEAWRSEPPEFPAPLTSAMRERCRRHRFEFLLGHPCGRLAPGKEGERQP